MEYVMCSCELNILTVLIDINQEVNLLKRGLQRRWEQEQL